MAIELKFTAKPFKFGNNSKAVIVPKAIADLLQDIEYEFVIREKEEAEQNEGGSSTGTGQPGADN